MAAQNNTISTDYVRAKIDKTQENSNCKIYGKIYIYIERESEKKREREREIERDIKQCKQLAQKDYESKNDWVGKMILMILCKR